MSTKALLKNWISGAVAVLTATLFAVASACGFAVCLADLKVNISLPLYAVGTLMCLAAFIASAIATVEAAWDWAKLTWWHITKPSGEHRPPVVFSP